MTSPRFLDEFLHYVPAATPHRSCVRAIISDLAARHADVSLRWDDETSVTEFNESTRVRIYPEITTGGGPVDPLWDLVHEWAHVCIGRASEAQLRTPRHERYTWDIAWQCPSSAEM